MNFVELTVTPFNANWALVWTNQAMAESGQNVGTLMATVLRRSKELNS